MRVRCRFVRTPGPVIVGCQSETDKVGHGNNDRSKSQKEGEHGDDDIGHRYR